jgi:regulator of protease activity HflC (stomatin/prohibitin superfamily)
MLPAVMLLMVEWLALLCVVWSMGAVWLLPLAALCVFCALLCLGRAWLAVLLAASTIALIIFLGTPSASPGGDALLMAAGMLVAGAALSFCGILASMSSGGPSDVVRCLLRMMVVLHFISAGVLLASRYLEVPLHGWLMSGHAALLLIGMADALLCLMARLYTPKRHWSRLRPPGAFFFFAWLGAEWRACIPSAFTEAEEGMLSLKLADMWMWPVVRGSLVWILTAVFFITWAATCVHEVPAGSHGVRQRFGSWEKHALEPGLHVSWPSPLGAVQIVDTGRVQEAVLGFRADPGRPILWERAHYEGEQQSLVGGGDDFLSISVPVHFRVSNPVLYLQQIAQPEALLFQEAQRVLLMLALPRSAGQIMTSEREAMRTEFRQRLQHSLDDHRSGLTITDVLLRDIHPPVSVAETFQEVVSAMEEKEAAIHEAESYRRDSVSNSHGTSVAMITAAESAAANRVSQVHGQAARFHSQLAAWSASPQLYQWREGFRVFDEALGGTKKAVFDHAAASRLPAHIDLRKVLNPDFVDSAPPVPQTLVPRAAKSLDAFDMEIEGYIRMDQGAIPAVDLRPPDADNLLKTPAPPASTSPPAPASKQP